MSAENLSTRAGYGLTPGRRKNDYVEGPKSRLENLFEYWLDVCPVEDIEISVNEGISPAVCFGVLDPIYDAIVGELAKINGIKDMKEDDFAHLIVKNRGHHRIKQAGLFLSACYNTIDKQEVTFEIETDDLLDYLGYRLPADKTLLIKSDAGYSI